MNSYLVCLIIIGVIGIAEIQARPGCKSGWKSFGNGGKCYKAFGGYTLKKKKDSAAVACKQAGGYLTEPMSKEENDNINSLITDESFIGFSDRAKEGKFVTDRTGNCLNYDNWDTGEPNNSGGKEDCVTMVNVRGKKGVWNDVKCGSSHSYVCEYQVGWLSWFR